jgi:hypothetical protein
MASSQAGQTKQETASRKSEAGKRHYTGEAACTPKKAALPTSTVTVSTKNFFAPPPLRITNMDTDAPVTESKSKEVEATGKSGLTETR